MSDNKLDFSEYGNVQSPMEAIESLVVAFVTAGFPPPTKLVFPKAGLDLFNLSLKAKERIQLIGSPPSESPDVKKIHTYSSNIVELVEEES